MVLDFLGYGIYTWADDRKYKGYWVNNKMHGEGEFVWPDNKLYKGNLKSLMNIYRELR